MYLDRTSQPGEEEQFHAYRQILAAMRGKRVIIRTLDVGGDKTLPYLHQPHEENPFLGCRGLRFSLREEDMFRSHLRAVLRASAYGKAHLLLPMVTGVEEVRRAREILEEEKEALRRRKVAFDENLPMGVMVETVSAAQAAQRDYREYVETWVHEVKTPITAARLLCRGLEGTTRRRLEGELAQIEAHVERALFYARAESPEKDLVVRPTPLAGLVRQAVQAHRTLLIQNGVRVEAEAVAGTVYTDEKWAAFLLGQLLQNAARYRRDRPVITLTAQPLGDRVALTVADNGLGIPAQELPRIFDRGFTGTNGRQRGGATGMGLYLARQVAEALAIDLQAASQVGEGSVFTLTFPAPENLTKS